MENFLEFLKSRRSIRKFSDREIDESTQKDLLEAVRWSQSWANTQCWEVIVVKDPEKRLEVQSAFFGKNPAVKSIVSAPLLFVMCAKKKVSGFYNNESPTILGDWFMFDVGIATQDLCLCAASKGLGSVVAGMFDHEKVAKSLCLPDDVQVVALVSVGYPAQKPKAPERKSIESFTHIDMYGEKRA